MSARRGIQHFLYRRPGVTRLLVVIALFLLWEASARWLVDQIGRAHV